MSQKTTNKIFILLLVIVFAVVVVGVSFIANYYFPAGNDFDCPDFKTRKQMLMIFLRAGGPQNDPYNLDQNKDGLPCTVYKYSDDII